MPSRRGGGGHYYTKTAIIDLLDREAGLKADELLCNAEMAAVLVCYAANVSEDGEAYSGSGCEQVEQQLMRCQMRMEDSGVHKLKADLKRSLVFNMLRMANHSKGRLR